MEKNIVFYISAKLKGQGQKLYIKIDLEKPKGTTRYSVLTSKDRLFDNLSDVKFISEDEYLKNT